MLLLKKLCESDISDTRIHTHIPSIIYIHYILSPKKFKTYKDYRLEIKKKPYNHK